MNNPYERHDCINNICVCPFWCVRDGILEWA